MRNRKAAGFLISKFSLPVLRLNFSKLRIILYLVCLALLWPAESTLASALKDTLSADGCRIGRVTAKLVTAPLHASGQDWRIAGGIATGVVLSSMLDRTLRIEVRRQRGTWASRVDDVGHTFQQEYVILGTAGAFYWGGLAIGRSGWRRTGIEIIEAYAISGAGTQLMKHIIGRDRPFAGNGPYHVTGPSLHNEHLSFPSGDATKSFAFASVLAAEARSFPVTVIVYGLAAATAFQRMHHEDHWLSDVIGGGAWGTAVGLGTVYLNRKHVHVTPAGIAVEW